MLEGVDRPVAKAMTANLDLRHLMGFHASVARGKGRKAPLMPFYLEQKQAHPTKVLLVRVRCPFHLQSERPTKAENLRPKSYLCRCMRCCFRAPPPLSVLAL